VEKLLFSLGFLFVCFLLWSLLQGALLRGAGAIFNGVSGRGVGADALPDMGLWKSTGIAALAVIVNSLISYLLLGLLVRGGDITLGSSFVYLLVAQVAALLMSAFVVAALLMLLLPAPFGRSVVVSLIWSGLFLLAGVLFYLLLFLLTSVNRPLFLKGDAYSAAEIGVFAFVLVLLEVPVFYASTALAGPEPSLAKTFWLPMVTAVVWGAAAVVGYVLLTPATGWLDPEYRLRLVGYAAAVVFGSLIVQCALYSLLLPCSISAGIWASGFQLVLRLLLYCLLVAVNFVFLALYQAAVQQKESEAASLIGPALDALALLL
jgi:hypothetical protein